MADDLLASVKSLLKAKSDLAALQRRVLDELQRLLPDTGFRMPADGTQSGTEAAPRVRRPPAKAVARRTVRSAMGLACPKCSRRFARPVNLGRHLAATHGRKRKTA